MQSVVESSPLLSFKNPCELVRSTCRKWMEEEGSIIIDDVDDDDDDDDDDERQYWIQKQEPSNSILSSSSSKKGQRRSVLIRHDNLPILANEILMQQKLMAVTTTTETKDTWIEWDTEGWHYNGLGFNGTEDERRERVALYLLALDAINFCFWPMPEEDGDDININSTNINPLEYEHLATTLKKMAEADHVLVSKSDDDDDSKEQHRKNEYVFSPNNLVTMTPEKMMNLLNPYLDKKKYPLPNIKKRAQLWREVGEGILRDYNGTVITLLDRAEQDASKLVELTATSFPGFRDEVYITSSSSSSTPQQRLVFLKRAQIFVGDINAALKLQLNGMERLTTFADYRVPQVLRHWDILLYAPPLANKVDNFIEIKKGSHEEVSIRSATIVVVEDLVKLLNNQNHCNEIMDNNENNNNNNNANNRCEYTDVTVDWYLWQVGERMHQDGLMKPFHKVRTHFY